MQGIKCLLLTDLDLGGQNKKLFTPSAIVSLYKRIKIPLILFPQKIKEGENS